MIKDMEYEYGSCPRYLFTVVSPTKGVRCFISDNQGNYVAAYDEEAVGKLLMEDNDITPDNIILSDITRIIRNVRNQSHIDGIALNLEGKEYLLHEEMFDTFQMSPGNN